ncbi:MAG TPA: DEAD/DEAH box helicase [Candidatus Poseidoniales archaeon]|nr:MAG TPA: DEAD/DEAH box helicase [Candidatus Poseidoniales archaeon]HII19377.1 DEAD/DEAH box helicase [Candidatus Poseidoniaceae archaeon]
MELDADRIEHLPLPETARSFLQTEWGIERLHPPQAEAMPAVFSERNTIVAIPTASGKSLVAYLGILHRLLVTHPGSRAIYIVPLKALASEKHTELVELAKAVGLSVGLGIGEATGERRLIDECDILVCTSEKLDSLMRTRSDRMANVSIVVADEFHLLNDSSRGPTLEINLTRLRHLRPDAQIIALSATVGNAPDLAAWLDAALITSDWRPVALEYSTLYDLHLEPRKLQTNAESGGELRVPRKLLGPTSHPTWAVLNDVADQEGQVLIFVSTRRSAVSEAKRLSERFRRRLVKEDQARLDRLTALATSLEGADQTTLGETLRTCVSGGVAFHHAGLTHGQRGAIESAFKQGDLVGIVATPTLAAGVNLPARRVLVRDVKRFDDGASRPMPVMEVRQMLGRAGRPRYDDFGEAWVLCKGTDGWEVADRIADHYFHGPVEDVTSKLANEAALRIHVLSAVAAGRLEHRGDIEAFFSRTFLATQWPAGELLQRLGAILDWLVEERFLRRLDPDPGYVPSALPVEEEAWDDDVPTWAAPAHGRDDLLWEGGSAIPTAVHKKRSAPAAFGFTSASSFTQATVTVANVRDMATRYEATPMGEAVTRLYLDPASASVLRTGLRRAVRRLVREDAPVTVFSLLHLAASTNDFARLWLKSKDMDRDSELWKKYAHVTDEVLIDEPFQERDLSTVKSAWLLESWIDEKTLRQIEAVHDVAPGDLHHRTDLMAWLLAASEAVLATDDVFHEDHASALQSLTTLIDESRHRVRHGCRADLLRLVKVRHVGRQRARRLAEVGVRTPEDLLGMTPALRADVEAWRGWGPVLVQRMIDDAARFASAPPPKVRSRRDDEPLPGERSSER